MLRLRKNCECKGTSSAGQLRGKETGRGKDYIKMAVDYYIGPSCDVCGKPWVHASTQQARTKAEVIERLNDQAISLSYCSLRSRV